MIASRPSGQQPEWLGKMKLKATERDCWLALKKFRKTIQSFRKRKQYPVRPVYMVGKQLLTSTGDIVASIPPTRLQLRKQRLRAWRWACKSPKPKSPRQSGSSFVARL